jgi:segregation and condensation protein A
MLLAFKDVLSRAEMFAHHHVARERLSVRQRMSDILSTLRETAFMDFARLFRAEEGRMGVTVTFIAILELMKEGLIEIVQAEPYAPIHVRPAAGSRHLTVVSDNDAEDDGLTDADAENEAALAQPAYPDENDEDEEPEELDLASESSAAEGSASETTAEAAANAVVELADDDGIATHDEERVAAAMHDASEDEESSTDDTVTSAPSDDENAGQGQ